MKAAITSSPLPEQAEINLKIEVKSCFNITSLVARQNVNLFLLFSLGNLVTAGEPILLIGEKLRWRVPVIYSLPGKGQLGQVGELAGFPGVSCEGSPGYSGGFLAPSSQCG